MEELVQRTRAKLLRIARRIGAPQDAEDSVQAAYHTLLGRPDLPVAPTLPWLITTVIRIAYRRKAIVARQSAIAEHLARPNPEPSPADHAARAELSVRIRGAVEELSATYRNPLVLYYLEGPGAAETARLLDLSPSTLRTRLERGRKLLRSTLGPVGAYGLMLVPWLLLDGGRAFAGASVASIGGAMQVKAAATVIGVGLATGALGLFVGANAADRSGSAPVARADRGEQREILELNELLADREEMILTLRERIDRGEPDTTPANSAGSGPAGISGKMPGPRKLSIDAARVSAAADRLGVTEQEIRIAERALRNVENLADPVAQREALDALHGLGERRTRAMMAVLTGVTVTGIGSGGVGPALAAAHVDGQEQLLVDLLKDAETERATKEDVLRSIEPFDSLTVRDYLLERLAAESNPYFHTNLMMALGRLKEPRVVPEIRKLLQRDGTWIAFHDYGLFTLGNVGGPEAESLLTEYLRKGTLVGIQRALTALAKLNPVAARGEAQAILAGPDASRLTAKTLEWLRQQAGQSR